MGMHLISLPLIGVSLAGMDLTSLNLTGVLLAGMHLMGVPLSRACISWACLFRGHISHGRASFVAMYLKRPAFYRHASCRQYLISAYLTGVHLRGPLYLRSLTRIVSPADKPDTSWYIGFHGWLRLHCCARATAKP
jgi:uncharacterized protein YjbI with pentapeptide repeats